MNVSFTTRARRQLVAAKIWWLKNRDKAPHAFDEEIERAMSLLSLNPVAGKPVPSKPGARKLTIRRIHYDIYYRLGDEGIEVLAIDELRRRSQNA